MWIVNDAIKAESEENKKLDELIRKISRYAIFVVNNSITQCDWTLCTL